MIQIRCLISNIDVPGRSVQSREMFTKFLPILKVVPRLMVEAVRSPPGRVDFQAKFVYHSLVFIAPPLDISDLKIFTLNTKFLDLNAVPGMTTTREWAHDEPHQLKL